MSNIVFELFAKLGLDTSGYEKGLKGAKGLASSAGGAIGNGLKTAAKVGAAALGAATTAATGFAVSSVKAGMEFDSSMSQVAATMGLTMDEMQNQLGTVDTAWGTFSGNIRDYAQFMGSNTAFSATEAADALNYMALAGYDAQTSMEMLPNVLNLAAAGNFDLARASDMVTDTQTAFGLSLERTSQLVDEMAKASSTGNTSVEQLGDAFLTVGGLAQELNGGMIEISQGVYAPVDGVQELEIALTAMANAGIKGSEAGTHMRNMLLKLASPTSEGTKQLEALGVSVFDAGGNMRSLENIMGDLNGALGDLTQEEKIQAIGDLFNTRDLASAEALLNAVGDDWTEIGRSILDSEGAAQKMADTQLDNLAGDVTLFQSALEGAKIAISDELTPDLRKFVSFGTEGLSTLTSAFKEGGLSGAMDAFGTILANGISMVIEMLPQMIEAGMQLLGALGKGIVDNAPQIFSAFKQIGGIIGDAVLDLMGNMDESLQSVDWGDMASNIATFMQDAFSDAPEFIDTAASIISGLASGIGEMLPELIPTAIDILMQLVNSLIENVPVLLDGAIQLIIGLANGLIQALPVLIERIPEIISSCVDAMTENIPLLIDGAIQLVNGIVAALPDIISALVDALPQIVESLVTGFLTNVPMLIEGAIQLVLAIVAAIPQIIVSLIQAIPQIILSIVQALIAAAPKMIEAAKSIVDSLKNGIKQLFPQIVQNAVLLFNGLKTTLINTAKKFIDIGKNIVDGIKNGIKNAWDSFTSWFTGLFDGLVGGIKKFFGIASPSKLMRDEVGKWIPAGIANGIKENFGLIDDAIDDMNRQITIGTNDFGIISSTSGMAYNNNGMGDNIGRIISLLEQIANNDNVTVVLDGGLDRLFRVMQTEAQRNKQITGQESFA